MRIHKCIEAAWISCKSSMSLDKVQFSKTKKGRSNDRVQSKICKHGDVCPFHGSSMSIRNKPVVHLTMKEYRERKQWERRKKGRGGSNN